MDSFEWFGEIGNQQFDSLKPPGDIHREVFSTATMGLESFGGPPQGGGDGPDFDEVADWQHEAATNAYDDGWEREQRNFNQSVLINSVNRRNEEVVAQLKDKVAMTQWDYQTKIQEAQYNAQVKQYNKAEKLYEAQIEYNTVAADMAYEQEAAVTKERFFQLAYQGASQELASDMKRQEAGLKLRSGRDDIAFKLQDLMVKQIQGEGKVRARGQVGRSADKQYQSLVAEAGRNTALLKNQLLANDQQYNLVRAGIEGESALQKEQRQQAKLSIGEAYGRATKKIGMDEYAANMQADAARLNKPAEPIPIPKPFKTPRSIIVDPMLPQRGKPPVWGAGMSGAGMADSGGGMTGGQMVGMGLQTAAAVAAVIPGGQVPAAAMTALSFVANAFG